MTDIPGTYTNLIEKSKSLLNFTRCIDETESGYWETYYNKCFELFSKLWTLQLHHRHELETHCGLTRADFWHPRNNFCSLRTSDPTHLDESETFFTAIVSRKYYSTDVETEPELRYLKTLGRLVLVHLLKFRSDRVVANLSEMRDLLSRVDRRRHSQWERLMQDLSNFCVCLGHSTDAKRHSNMSQLLHKRPHLHPLPYRVGASDSRVYHLAKAVLFSQTSGQQAKFDNFSVDSFRMFTCLSPARILPAKPDPERELLG
ncbi:hypothetical protein Ciccas_000702 [Cichlidogyrus casuarinus]|uniref:Uncharacterized protein n=1 Tax=Cichlidogyrus casuarinus TaxID=1844966 RepID=A0ABD2QM65_9PLAT